MFGKLGNGIFLNLIFIILADWIFGKVQELFYFREQRAKWLLKGLLQK